MSINKAIIQGRVVADIELRSTPTGNMVANFTLACDRRTKPGEEKTADFIDMVAWGNTAEFIAKHFRKGSMMAVVGHLQTRNWEDKQGNKRKTTEVKVDEAHFCEPKREDNQSMSRGGYTGGFRPVLDANDGDLPW